MTRIFISYSRVDRALTSELASRLRRINGSGNVWYDESLHGGDVWWQAILTQIAQCDIFVYLLSRDSIESEHCLAELNEARRLRKPVLPVLVRARTPIPPDLSVIQYVDMSEGITLDTITDMEAAINTLAGNLMAPSRRLADKPVEVPPSDQAKVDRTGSTPHRSRNRLLFIAIAAVVIAVSVAVLVWFVPSARPITIPGNAATLDWLDSGIFIKAGQVFSVSASGSFNTWENCESEKKDRDLVWVNCFEMINGPEGGTFTLENGRRISSAAEDNWENYPLPDARLWALLGRVGDSGRILVIGRGGEFKAETSGNLQFRINDGPYQDNSGEFLVTVTLQ